MTIGFSTGCLYQSNLPILDIISAIRSVEDQAIELNFGRVEELTGLTDADINSLKDALVDFDVVSIHAPFRGVSYDFGSDKVIEKLKQLVMAFDASHVVFHPDTIKSGTIIEEMLGEKAAIENMDKNKSSGQFVSDLKSCFQQMPSARFVLDLNHVFTLDRSMMLAHDFYCTYSDRIIAYHISGYGGEDALHVGLSQSNTVLSGVFDKSILIIHEGVVDTVEQMKGELCYLRDHITE